MAVPHRSLLLTPQAIRRPAQMMMVRGQEGVKMRTQKRTKGALAEKGPG